MLMTTPVITINAPKPRTRLRLTRGQISRRLARPDSQGRLWFPAGSASILLRWTQMNFRLRPLMEPGAGESPQRPGSSGTRSSPSLR
jgi:hypothetical protein